MAVSPTHNGWRYDPSNTRLDFYFRGTRVGHIAAAAFVSTQAMTIDAGGLTITAGNAVATAGDVRVTAANVRLGAVETFGTTEPTSAVVLKAGTAPAGAITTSGGVFSSATVVQKIIADGTVSNVET